MPRLNTPISHELLAQFDETKGGMGKYLKKRQTTQEAIGVLLFVYDTVKREGRIADVLSRYQPAPAGPSGLEFR